MNYKLLYASIMTQRKMLLSCKSLKTALEVKNFPKQRHIVIDFKCSQEKME